MGHRRPPQRRAARAPRPAGCKVIQIEEPAIHSAAAHGALHPSTGTSSSTSLNHTVEGLDEVELWVHTCWGNPGLRSIASTRRSSYEPSVDIYLNRLKADVWTIESKESGHSLLPAFAPWTRADLPKKVAARHDQPPGPPGRDARGRGRRHPYGAPVHRRRQARPLVALRLREDRCVRGLIALYKSKHVRTKNKKKEHGHAQVL